MSEKSQQEYLEDILHLAENLTSPPKVQGEIPKQWLPEWLRLILKLSYLPVLLLDLFAQKVARYIIQPPFKQVGSCKRRGNCCYFILIPQPSGTLGKIFYFWQTQVNGFFLRSLSPQDEKGKKMLVMGCRHLNEDGSCNSYKTRPSVCRRWPVIEYFGAPRVLKGCGFSPVLKKKYDKEPYISLLSKSKEEGL
ncbi:MAG: YkgJ family cysteine cluster protein [Chlamydiae bacterium]|nr:YkgJ family cysteine cluster protein [Chlamydiota bacterium]